MHDMPDTEDADADAERFWPEEYKAIIRDQVKSQFTALVLDEKTFSSIYAEQFQDRFSDYESFIARLAEMVIIGAENGADEIFDEIYDAFRKEQSLPANRSYAAYHEPRPVSSELKEAVVKKVTAEYKDLHLYEHVYEDHYEGELSFEEFIAQVAELVATGTMNGADDALGKIYHSFFIQSSLPLLRRYPRRIR